MDFANNKLYKAVLKIVYLEVSKIHFFYNHSTKKIALHLLSQIFPLICSLE